MFITFPFLFTKLCSSDLLVKSKILKKVYKMLKMLKMLKI